MNITLPKASSIIGGVQVGCRPSSVITTKPKKIFRTVALFKSFVSNLPLASMSGKIPFELFRYCWYTYKSLQYSRYRIPRLPRVMAELFTYE